MGILVRNGLNSSMDIERKYQVNICPKLIIEEATTTRVNVINDETLTILKNFWQSLYHTLFATVASCPYLVLPPQSLTKQ